MTTSAHTGQARPGTSARLVGWGSFLGFGGILFSGEGLILAMEAVGEDHAVPTDPVPLAQAIIVQAPFQGVIMIVGLLGTLVSLVLFLRARPIFGSILDFSLGVIGLLVSALVSGVALVDSKIHGLGTLMFGLAAAGVGSWSFARAFDQGQTPKAASVNAVASPAQVGPPQSPSAGAALPIIFTVAAGAAFWMLYKGRRRRD